MEQMIQTKQRQNNLTFGTGLSSEKQYEPLLNLVARAIENGIMRFDTAPSYGCEDVLGRVFNQLMGRGVVLREHLWIQDKIDAWQMQEGNGSVERFIDEALKKMQLDYFDCVLIHWPVPEWRDSTLRSLMSAKECGKINSVGICNVQKRQLLDLEASKLLPDVVQIERNPLRICADEIDFCHGHGIEVQSYSPLCKFRPEIRESTVLKSISEKHGRSIGQVVMRWHIDTGVYPIFTTKKAARIVEYSDIFMFSLDKEDITAINEMNRNYKIYLESVACPGF